MIVTALLSVQSIFVTVCEVCGILIQWYEYLPKMRIVMDVERVLM